MRGRKRKQESREEEIHERLAEWKQMPESSRPSLRALARQMGTSHQLLRHFLERWDKWQKKEYELKAEELRTRAEMETRPWVRTDMFSQAEAYDRAAFRCMVDSVMEYVLRKCEQEIKREVKAGRPLHTRFAKFLRIIASKGHEKAQAILERYFPTGAKMPKINLPASSSRASKSFRIERVYLRTGEKHRTHDADRQTASEP